jgi:hypothetical protein
MTKTMGTMPLKANAALLELSLINAETSDASFDDVMVEALKRGIAPEIVTRLSEVWAKAFLISGEIIGVGRIVVTKILEFVVANPKIAIGAALGACATTLVASVPFIGPLLAPLTASVFMLYGAGIGAAAQSGDYSMSPVSAAFELAQKFFELLVAIFNGIKEHWITRGEPDGTFRQERA